MRCSAKNGHLLHYLLLLLLLLQPAVWTLPLATVVSIFRRHADVTLRFTRSVCTRGYPFQVEAGHETDLWGVYQSSSPQVLLDWWQKTHQPNPLHLCISLLHLQHHRYNSTPSTQATKTNTHRRVLILFWSRFVCCNTIDLPLPPLHLQCHRYFDSVKLFTTNKVYLCVLTYLVSSAISQHTSTSPMSHKTVPHQHQGNPKRIVLESCQKTFICSVAVSSECPFLSYWPYGFGDNNSTNVVAAPSEFKTVNIFYKTCTHSQGVICERKTGEERNIASQAFALLGDSPVSINFLQLETRLFKTQATIHLFFHGWALLFPKSWQPAQASILLWHTSIKFWRNQPCSVIVAAALSLAETWDLDDHSQDSNSCYNFAPENKQGHRSDVHFHFWGVFVVLDSHRLKFTSRPFSLASSITSLNSQSEITTNIDRTVYPSKKTTSIEMQNDWQPSWEFFMSENRNRKA